MTTSNSEKMSIPDGDVGCTPQLDELYLYMQYSGVYALEVDPSDRGSSRCVFPLMTYGSGERCSWCQKSSDLSYDMDCQLCKRNLVVCETCSGPKFEHLIDLSSSGCSGCRRV